MGRKGTYHGMQKDRNQSPSCRMTTLQPPCDGHRTTHSRQRTPYPPRTPARAPPRSSYCTHPIRSGLRCRRTLPLPQGGKGKGTPTRMRNLREASRLRVGCNPGRRQTHQRLRCRVFAGPLGFSWRRDRNLVSTCHDGKEGDHYVGNGNPAGGRISCTTSVRKNPIQHHFHKTHQPKGTGLHPTNRKDRQEQEEEYEIENPHLHLKPCWF
mmetsp:Transcript_14122/g.28998  ORF Transcript_14122/g.28998 Transcript_14122/m.28998 type:complete len:210 (-) Transcript_14122:431-1060(-)